MSHDTHDTHHEHSESHHSQADAHGHTDASAHDAHDHGHGHHAHGHHAHGHEDVAKQTTISFRNSFWLIIIIVGLFIAALNFIKAESGETEDHAPTREIMETGSGHTGKGAENKEMQAEHEATEEAHHQPKAEPAAEHAPEAGH
jgi:hypothetical protein